MCARPAVLDSALVPFAAAGLRVSVVGAHLLLHDVPVVDDQRRILLGTLVATFIYTDSAVTPPVTHQVWFDGPYPCYANGRAIEALRHSDVPGHEIASGVRARYFFSNKATDWTGYGSHLELLMHYWRIITDQAREIDPHATRSVTPGGISIAPKQSPFRYPDACSARGNFMDISERLAQSRVAIVGLGGTGSYVLDQVAKTPVREIHLFDGDVFEVHNAFRAPGAAHSDDFQKMKVDYFATMYDHMHDGIKPHPVYVTEDNCALLGTFDFVFVCVDRGLARRLICEALRAHGVTFLDCGMDLSVSSARQIFGSCRATLCTPEKGDHFAGLVPTMDDAGDALYAENIQIADANALNALLAVMRWKQHLGFYASHHDWHHIVYMIDVMGLAKANPGGVNH